MTAGALIVVGTPIGNLDDISPRAVATLATVDAIACEDTRRTGRLLAHIGVRTPRLLVANEHTEADVAAHIIERIQNGERIALVSDAGMPGISDPGEFLVRAVTGAGCAVEIVPGPSAMDTALAVSGLATGRFVFEGFLPRKGAARRVRLGVLAAEPRTAVLYEAPHRLARTLQDLIDTCGPDRPVALLRELTKLHEEHWRGTLWAASDWVASNEPRGEYVLVLGGAPEPAPVDDDVLRNELARLRAEGASTRDAVAQVALHFGEPHRRVYGLATQR